MNLDRPSPLEETQYKEKILYMGISILLNNGTTFLELLSDGTKEEVRYFDENSSLSHEVTHGAMEALLDLLEISDINSFHTHFENNMIKYLYYFLGNDVEHTEQIPFPWNMFLAHIENTFPEKISFWRNLWQNPDTFIHDGEIYIPYFTDEEKRFIKNDDIFLLLHKEIQIQLSAVPKEL
jgi:hypothetical protein